MAVTVNIAMSDAEVRQLSDAKLASIMKHLGAFTRRIDNECASRDIWVTNGGRMYRRVVEERTLTLEEDC